MFFRYNIWDHSKGWKGYRIRNIILVLRFVTNLIFLEIVQKEQLLNLVWIRLFLIIFTRIKDLKSESTCRSAFPIPKMVAVGKMHVSGSLICIPNSLIMPFIISHIFNRFLSFNNVIQVVVCHIFYRLSWPFSL
jgi:hypothetical protein